MVVGFLPFLQFALCSKSWQDRERSWQDLAMTGSRPWHNHESWHVLGKILAMIMARSYQDYNKMDSYVSFIEHRRTRLSQAASVVLQTPLCRTTTFQLSYFNRIVKPWNCICKNVHPDTFSSPISFKNYLKRKYTELVKVAQYSF